LPARFVQSCIRIGPLVVLGFWVATFGVFPAHAQAERESTEERLRDIRYQIELDQQRLSETAAAERATISTLEQIEREAALRRELVDTYRRRQAEIERQSDSLRTSMADLEREITDLREQYHLRARNAYVYGRMHDLALILAAESINQMLVRARYLQRFTSRRRTKMDEIRQTVETFESRREELRSALARNEELLHETEQEQRNLGRLQQSRRQVVAELRSQRSVIEADIARKRASARELEERIRRLAAADQRSAGSAAEPFDAAAYAALTGSFTDNRGRLPWPSRGVIREAFGNIVNPVYGTTTPNPGILIDTQPQADVRSVFEGTVVDVDVMPEYGTIVVIQHGEYRSVYSNFSALYVERGDLVSAGQMIGRSGTQNEPKGPALFFAIFRSGQAIDPAPWLQRL
jgi:murein hydrolase activator